MPPFPAPIRRNKYQPHFDPAHPPPRVTRPMAAQLLLAQFGIVVAPRTLEAWPLPVRILGGRATFDTNEVLARGRAMLDDAPAICGGRTRAANDHA